MYVRTQQVSRGATSALAPSQQSTANFIKLLPSDPIRPSSSSPFSSPLPLFDSSVTLPFVRPFCTVVCLLCIDHGEHCRAVSLLLSAHTGAGMNAREEELVPTSFGRSFANFAFVVDSSPDTCLPRTHMWSSSYDALVVVVIVVG